MTEPFLQLSPSLYSVPIQGTWHAEPGRALTWFNDHDHVERIMMNPLDVIAMTVTNPYERLDLAMAAILRRAHARLDNLAQALTEAMENPALAEATIHPGDEVPR